MWQASLFKTIYLTSRTLSRKISPSLLLNVAWEVNTAMRSLIYTLCESRYNLHWLLSNNINKIHHTIVTQCTKQTSPDNTVTDVKRQIMHSVGCLLMKVVPDAFKCTERFQSYCFLLKTFRSRSDLTVFIN